MAERYTEKRKLKKSFLIISNISKFLKAHGKTLLVGILIIGVIALYFKPEPEPEPGFFDELKQSAGSGLAKTKDSIGNVWGRIKGFWGKVGSGIAEGFGSVGSYFGKLF